jgi:DNA adenine methylase
VSGTRPREIGRLRLPRISRSWGAGGGTKRNQRTHVSLECRPALEVIAWYGRSSDVLLYIDPPYLGSERASGSYRCEMTSDDEHRELADALHNVKAPVVLSGYPSELYEQLYAGWSRAEFEAGTGQNAETWANRTEVIWSNRPFPFEQPDLFEVSAS